MKRTLVLRVTVNYPRGWTQPDIKEFIKIAIEARIDEKQNSNPELPREDTEWPVIEAISPMKMVTDYA